MELTKLAKGKHCKIRIPGICCHDPETVVSCHYRMPGLSGYGIKAPDWAAADGCVRCHDAVDFRITTTYSRAALKLMHLEGVLRTIDERIDEGALPW